MADTGAKLPGSVNAEVSDDNSRDWGGGPASGPWSNVQADDGTLAAHFIEPGNQTDTASAYNFDFSAIPDGATIDGIVVVCEGCETTNGRDCSWNLAILTTDGGSTTTGSNNATTTIFAGGSVNITHGGPSDTWGASLTSAIVKNSGFGVNLRGQSDDGANVQLKLDSVQMTVYYTESGLSASGDVTVAAVTADGTAAVERDASGAVSITAATADGAASVERDASGAVTTPAATADGSAAVSGATNASGAVSITAATADGAAAREVDASGAVSTGAATADGTAAREVDASGAVSAPAATADGSATVAAGPTASGAVVTPAATASGTVVVTRKASGAVSIGAVSASGVADREIDATGAVTIPSATADGAALEGSSTARIATAAQSRNFTVLANNGRNSTTLS